MKLLEGLFSTLEPLCGDPQQRHIMNLPHKERGSWVGYFSERFLLDCEFCQSQVTRASSGQPPGKLSRWASVVTARYKSLEMEGFNSKCQGICLQ